MMDEAPIRADERARILNTPELRSFADGVVIEALHQRERWGAEHDQLKTPWDWFWTLGYLSQKAAHAALCGDRNKALHHMITAAALLANWHRDTLAAEPCEGGEGDA